LAVTLMQGYANYKVRVRVRVGSYTHAGLR
jgi:hypothetical protein